MLHTCFPERLKSLRQEKNIKQSELAEHLKVTKLKLLLLKKELMQQMF